jgi:hypothetical protein
MADTEVRLITPCRYQSSGCENETDIVERNASPEERTLRKIFDRKLKRIGGKDQ